MACWVNHHQAITNFSPPKIFNDKINDFSQCQSCSFEGLCQIHAYEYRTKFREEITETNTLVKLEMTDFHSIYLLGTAHVSTESRNEVVEVIEKLKPDIVFLELCAQRRSLLEISEEELLQKYDQLTLNELNLSIKRNGLASALTSFLFIYATGQISKQLGVVPGGEFRSAFNSASLNIPSCLIHLGDRPVNITFQRFIASLSFYDKLKLFFSVLFSSKSISKEEVERMKNVDILNEMVKELSVEFPQAERFIINERDQYMCAEIKKILKSAKNNELPIHAPKPTILVVVGFGHLPGIRKNFNENINQRALLKIPKPKQTISVGTIIKLSLIGTVGLIFSYKLTKLFYR